MPDPNSCGPGGFAKKIVDAADNAAAAQEAATTATTARDEAVAANDTAVSAKDAAVAAQASVDADATTARLKAWEAEAERMTADSYATEPQNVHVKRYTSNGDGTFSIEETGEYSALHHQREVEATMSSVVALPNGFLSFVFWNGAAGAVPVRQHNSERYIDFIPATGAADRLPIYA